MPRQVLASKLCKVGIFNHEEYLKKEYLGGKSCNEIAENLKIDYNIYVSPRWLSIVIKNLGVLRTASEAKQKAIKSGRMIYLKKPEAMKYKTKSISANMRYNILSRDGFKCVKCGGSVASGSVLELHHIKGEESTEKNLITLCFLCHRGLHSQK